MPSLVFVAGPIAGRRYRLSQGDYIIGRRSDGAGAEALATEGLEDLVGDEVVRVLVGDAAHVGERAGAVLGDGDGGRDGEGAAAFGATRQRPFPRTLAARSESSGARLRGPGRPASSRDSSMRYVGGSLLGPNIHGAYPRPCLRDLELVLDRPQVALIREGATIVVVTHEPDVARYASRLVRFKDGRVLSDARQTPADAAQELEELQKESASELAGAAE